MSGILSIVIYCRPFATIVSPFPKKFFGPGNCQLSGPFSHDGWGGLTYFDSCQAIFGAKPLPAEGVVETDY